MELQKRIELVKAAIERIEGLEAQWRELEADARADIHVREKARYRWQMAEQEFRWQWRNVKDLLAAWERGEKYDEKEPT